jgi:hypothetical protein
MGLEYITRPQVFLAPITAVNGIQGVNNPFPLLTTYQSWVSTGTVNTSAFPIPGTWTMLDQSGSFIVTVGNVIQSPTDYSIDRTNRILTFSSIVSAGIEVGATQLATAAPSSTNFNYIQSVSSVFVNLSAVNGNINNLYVNSLTALSAIINVVDITNVELSGFTASGNLNVIGNLSALNIYSPVATFGDGILSRDFNSTPLTLLDAASGSAYLALQNTYSSVSASTDISVYNDTGNYLDLGINSSSYNGNRYSPTFNVVGPGDSYLYSTANDFAIGTSARGTNNDIIFFTGGSLSGTNVATGNERMRITNTGGIYSGNIGIGTSAPNSALTVVGDISATGFAYTGGNTRNFLRSIIPSSLTFAPVLSVNIPTAGTYMVRIQYGCALRSGSTGAGTTIGLQYNGNTNNYIFNTTIIRTSNGSPDTTLGVPTPVSASNAFKYTATGPTNPILSNNFILSGSRNASISTDIESHIYNIDGTIDTSSAGNLILNIATTSTISITNPLSSVAGYIRLLPII